MNRDDKVKARVGNFVNDRKLMFAESDIYTVSKKRANFCKLSFDKHGLILIIFGKHHQHPFKNDKESWICISFLKVFWCCWLKIIKISPCSSTLQLAKVGAFFETQCINGWYFLVREVGRGKDVNCSLEIADSGSFDLFIYLWLRIVTKTTRVWWSAAVAVCREPCVNGARCVDVDVCQCRQGYTGTSCETGLYSPLNTVYLYYTSSSSS